MNLIKVDEFVNYLETTGKRTYAKYAKFYADKHPVEGVAFGEDLPEGTVIEVFKRDDGRQWMRIKKWSEAWQTLAK